MKIIKKAIKKILLYLGSIIALFALIIILFMSLAPQFGGKISKTQKKKFEKLDHYNDGKFLNKEHIDIKLDCHSITEMAKGVFKPAPNVRPNKNIEVEEFDVNQIQKNLNQKSRLTWLGHSSFLLEIDNKTILIDPVFSSYAAPHEWLGRKRFNDKMPFNPEDLKEIDAVIISHDHYDHLDYNTVKKIKDKVKNVIVPLGVGNHFKKWGIPSERIQELDWWNETQLGDIKIVCTPARHGSGRGLNDQSATLWSSWCFIGKNQKIFFSGDSGYGKHFKEIGNTYGPFDFAMIECGQYDDLWADIHMVPEESVQVGIDVKANYMMPIHWGAFLLANHDWKDPAERFIKKANELKVNYVTPKIGQSILIKSKDYPTTKWREVNN